MLSISCWSAGLDSFTDNAQHLANGYCISFLFDNLLQNATLFGGHFNIYLIRLQFHKGIALVNRITLVFEPICYYSIND
jgi:hypothetical protein